MTAVTAPARLPRRRRRRRAEVHRRQGRRPGRQRGPDLRLRQRLHRQPVQGQPDPLEPGGRQGRRRRAPSCSTPAAPTATPDPTASRPPTPSPSGSPSGSGIGAVDVVVCSTGLIGLANAARASCWPASTRRTPHCRPTAGSDAGRGDHDHRLGAASRSSSRAPAGRSAGWPRAPACWRPQLATMLVVLTTDAVVPAADARHRAARRDPGQLRPARLRRLHVDQRHRHRAGQRRQRRSPRRRRTSPRR